MYYVLLKTSQICRKSRVFAENILSLEQVRRKENILSWSDLNNDLQVDRWETGYEEDLKTGNISLTESFCGLTNGRRPGVRSPPLSPNAHKLE